MTAEPFDCDACGRRIGKARTHAVTAGHVLCINCLLTGKRLHGRYHPGCPHAWHDLFDHPIVHATRAAAAWAVEEQRRPVDPSTEGNNE